MPIVTFLRVEGEEAIVAVDGKEMRVTPLRAGDEIDAAHNTQPTDETPEQAAVRWAHDAFKVTLTPVATNHDKIADALATIAADPTLAQATKDALATIAAMVKVPF